LIVVDLVIDICSFLFSSMAPHLLFVFADFLVALACMPHVAQSSSAASPRRVRGHFGVAPLVRSSVLPQGILTYSSRLGALLTYSQLLFNVRGHWGRGQIAIDGASLVLCGLQKILMAVFGSRGWFYFGLCRGPFFAVADIFAGTCLTELYTTMAAEDYGTLFPGGWR